MTSDRTPEFFKQPNLRVGVVGCGYVGLPLALRFAEVGHRVVGFDTDPHKVQVLNAGGTYIHRIPAERIARHVGAGEFRATADFSAVRELDAVLICVPTPLDERRQPDLSYVEGTARALAPHLQRGQLVVLESTTYPGTTDELVLPILEESGLRCPIAASGNDGADAPDFYLAFSPEREDPGNARFSLSEIPKVVGGINRPSCLAASALYGQIVARVVPVSSTRAAEMTKLLENIYRCVNIALVNELKLLSRRMGIDIWEVIESAATKPFGFTPFYPGPGLGGHCIPVDPFYLSWKAREFDFSTRFIELAGEINTAMPYHVLETVTGALNRQQEEPQRLTGADPRRRVQEGRRRPAGVACAQDHAAPRRGRRAGGVQRSVLPGPPTDAPLRLLDHALRGAGKGGRGRLRLRRHRDRPLELRLRRARGDGPSSSSTRGTRRDGSRDRETRSSPRERGRPAPKHGIRPSGCQPASSWRTCCASCSRNSGSSGM